MAGNEIEIIKFLIEGIDKITLKHLGKIKSISAPLTNGFKNINSVTELHLIASENSAKKADVYINNLGISLKQIGGSFPFNRLQRAELLSIFEHLGFNNAEAKLQRIDKEVDDYHNGLLPTRNRPWNSFMDEIDFKMFLKFLMTEGSPNIGFSNHKADFILEAPTANITEENINVFTFDEYFETYKNKISFAIRRQWIGQSSDSEHSRAVGLAKKTGNNRWIYDSISGEPNVSKKTNERWRIDVPENERRTVYLLFIEKR